MKLQQKDFKEGMSITCEIEGTKIDDAKLHREDGVWYICQNEKNGYCCKNKLGYEYSWTLSLSEKWKEGKQHTTNIQPKLKTLYNLEEGDIVIATEGGERMILGVHGHMYHLSDVDYFEVTGNDYTPQELEDEGYKIKGTPTKTKLTKNQIAKKFKIDVDELEIVEEE